MNGLDLWNAVEGVDHAYTKKIEGREFKGNTVNLTYTTKKLTEVLGPAGDRWGWEVVDEKVHEYGSHEQQNFTAIHAVRVRLWFRREDGTSGHIEDYGTTKLAYYAGSGSGRYLKVDEEACKKSISDAKSKLFVALGGSAEVWLGEFDRTQHKNVARERDEEEHAPTKPAAPRREAPREARSPEAVEVDEAQIARCRRVVTKELGAGSFAYADPAAGVLSQPFASADEACRDLLDVMADSPAGWVAAAMKANEPLINAAGDATAREVASLYMRKNGGAAASQGAH